MPTFYAPQMQGFQGLNVGEILARGQRYRAGEQAMRRSQSEEDQMAQIRPLETLGRQLAIRGQLLGAVETPEDYAAALPVIQAAGLPMADLPEDRRSTASQTFRRPEVPATSQARAAWMPDFGAPMAPAALPSGEMAAQGIAPEDVPTIQRRAQAGLPLQIQQRFQDADLGRQIQREELANRSEKYRTQLEYADRNADLAERRFSLQENQAQRQERLDRERMDIERQKATSAGTQGEAVKLALKDIPVFRDEARTAISGIKTLDQMQTLLAGGAGARPGQLKIFLSRLTGQQTEGMADAEVYQLLAETLRGPLRTDIVGPGPMTEAEQRLLGQVTGGGSTAPKAAARLLGIYRESAVGKIRNYNETRRRVGQTEPSVLSLYDELQIPGAGAAKPTAQFKETKVYNGATYGRNSPSENWKLVK